MAWFQHITNGNVAEVEALATTYCGARDSKGHTGLMLAASRNQAEVIEVLAQYELGMQDENGRTALMYAAANGSYFEALKNETRIQSNSGETALMIAVAAGHTLVCQRLLIERGLISKQGYTATTLALVLNRQDIAELLNEESSNINALMASAAAGGKMNEQLEKYINRRDEHQRSALWFALDAGNADMASALQIERNTCDAEGCTMLMKAAQSNLKDAVMGLKNQLKSVDNRGRTALMYACESGAIACVQELLDEVGMEDSEGKTASMYAAESGRLEALTMVISSESALRDHNNAHLMHYCIKGGLKTNILEQIAESYANNCDSEGKSSLVWACELNKADVIGLLMEYEAEMLGLEEETPAMYAAEKDSVDALDMVIKRYKKAKDSEGRTAANYALEHDSGKCIPVLLEKDPIPNILLTAASENKYRICKVVADVARFGTTVLSDFVYSSKAQQLCHNELNSITKKFMNVQDGFNALFTAIQSSASEAVRVLAPALGGKILKDGTTALMYYCQLNNTLNEKATRALIEACAGKQMKDGTSALMLACFTKADNLDLIKELAEFEVSLVNNSGEFAIQFAENAGREDVIEYLKNLQ